jgi:hypothetical protein
MGALRLAGTIGGNVIATTIYTGDEDLAANGIEAIRLDELPLPEKDRQLDIAWPERDELDEPKSQTHQPHSDSAAPFIEGAQAADFR